MLVLARLLYDSMRLTRLWQNTFASSCWCLSSTPSPPLIIFKTLIILPRHSHSSLWFFSSRPLVASWAIYTSHLWSHVNYIASSSYYHLRFICCHRRWPCQTLIALVIWIQRKIYSLIYSLYVYISIILSLTIWLPRPPIGLNLLRHFIDGGESSALKKVCLTC